MMPVANSRTRLLRWLPCLVLPLLVTGAAAESVLDAISAEVRTVYEKSRDSLVRVKAEPSPEGRVRMASGFFVDESGKFVTTATVASHAKRTWIEWQDQQFPAELLGADSRVNLALLRVTGPEARERKFPALPFGNAKDLRVGSAVIAMGSPFDLDPSPSFGLVEGFDLQQVARFFVTSHIRVGIPLNPGESGGPLLNTRGEVVGILVAAPEQSQSTFALPGHSLKRVVRDLEEYGEARYGWMGMSVLECRGAEAKEAKQKPCIRVQKVYTNSPAALAGIQEHDVILQVGDRPIRRICDMLDTSFSARVGDKLSIQVQRQASLTNFIVEIVQRPEVSRENVPASAAAKVD